MEFYAQHENENNVAQMLFLPGQGRLVTLTEDNQLHFWEINGTNLAEKKAVGMDGRLKQITALCLDSNNKKVLLGTEGGNIYNLDLVKFRIEESIIYQDIVMKNSPAEFKVNPGAVESILIHPVESNKILIGYARGLIVLWNRDDTGNAEKTYCANQQLEALDINSDGTQFISAHNDGSYMIWSTSKTAPLEPPSTPYGPYPCKAINKIFWSEVDG